MMQQLSLERLYTARMSKQNGVDKRLTFIPRANELLKHLPSTCDEVKKIY
jgi:hypothetical protein